MNRRSTRVTAAPILVAVLAAMAAGTANAQDLAGNVKSCRQIDVPARRLECYDAMPLAREQSAAAAAALVAPAPAAPPVVAEPVDTFGKESIKQSAATELQQIETRIPGKFIGWAPGAQLALANGQVWRIADGSEAVYNLQDPKVIVRRGMLGAFYLEIEGVGFQVRVTRVR